jgi:hypothetical protein
MSHVWHMELPKLCPFFRKQMGENRIPPPRAAFLPWAISPNLM